ncbi:MAG: hypothetical protein H0V17_33180, partial [Deltaproteobacteria bacterium]|nr:hypothetical protein [Deltaproteobacteria bacterium]
EKFADGPIACLKLAGTIDEAFDGKKLGASVTGEVLLVDLGAIKKISSFGIREWVDFVGAASKQVRSLILIECAPKVVDQLNMVANFTGGGRVFSFYAPFRCDYCNTEQRVLLQVDRDHETIKSMKLAERPCPSCKESMYFDDDGATFFSYIVGQPRFELEPAVAGFLASKLSYAVGALARKLRVDKIIEARVTYLRPVGDLDAAFPREKLIDGLEGTVVVDAGAIGRIQPAGAAEWRAFVTSATPLIEALYLADVPPALLEKVCGKGDLGAKAQVLSLTLPYTCAGCQTTSQQAIDVTTHHKTLKFATAPALRCSSCKAALTCVASEPTMTVLAGLPAPTAPADLLGSLDTLRERAVAAVRRRSEPSIVLPPQAAAAPPPRSSLVVPILIATLGLVLVAILVVAYSKSGGSNTENPQGSAKPRALTARSSPARPAWIDRLAVAELADDGVPAATCRPGAEMACAGMSSLHTSQGDAEDEALDAALAAVAGTLATKVTDAEWQAGVRGIYSDALAAKTAALVADPASTTARREAREGRRAVARALRAAGGEPVTRPSARYWEEYTGSSGKRYVAFAQVTLAAADVTRLVESATRRSAALGATVVDAHPLVGWRYPTIERGAIILSTTDGPLRTAGIPDQSIVLAIDGRPVADAASFARLATDQLAALDKTGGTLTLRVQTVDPA